MPAPATRQPERRRPPGRYDEPSRVGQRVLAVLLGLLLLGLFAAVGWSLYSRYGQPEVPVRERGFTVLGDDAVRVEFDVVPPAGRTAWCLVRARGASGVEVGRQHVVIPASDDSAERTVRHRLPTSERPVTGEVTRCRLARPPAGEPTAPISP